MVVPVSIPISVPVAISISIPIPVTISVAVIAVPSVSVAVVAPIPVVSVAGLFAVSVTRVKGSRYADRRQRAVVSQSSQNPDGARSDGKIAPLVPLRSAVRTIGTGNRRNDHQPTEKSGGDDAGKCFSRFHE